MRRTALESDLIEELVGTCSKPGDLPKSLCSLLNASRKGVQAAGSPEPLLESRQSPVPFVGELEIGGTFVANKHTAL